MSVIRKFTMCNLLLFSLLADTLTGCCVNSTRYLPVSEEDWVRIREIACMHGVVGLLASAIEMLPDDLKPSHDFLLEIIAMKIKVEARYDYQYSTMAMFANKLRDYDINCMILKGISFSTYYQTPSLRECSDCDCYLVTNNNKLAFIEGNDIAKSMGAVVERGTYKHSHIKLNGILIENHKYLTDFNGTEMGANIEKQLEHLIIKEPVKLNDKYNIMKPNSYFNAFFLIKHAHGNFMSEGLSLRMVYDWGALLMSEQNGIDWNDLYSELSQYKLRKFAEVLTSICVVYMRLPIYNKKISTFKNEKVINDVMRDMMRHRRLSCNNSILRKILQIAERFYRMWKFRHLAIEPYPIMVWNTFVYCSYMKRNVTLN